MSELNYASALAALDDDFASASAQTGSGNLPIGRYNAILKEAKIVARSNNGIALSVSFVVTEGQYRGRYAFTSYGLNKNGLPFFKGFLQMMPNKPYDNFFLANEIEDQYNSHLDLVQFCTVDNSLTGTAGMDYKVHVYKATDGTEKLTKGEGNTKTIEADFTEKVYKILLAQNRFSYFDEDAMTDPMVVTTGTRHAGVDLFNTQNTDIYAAFNDATLTLVTPALGFDAFVDAAAMLNLEELEGVTIFGFVNPAEMAKLRKALKDDLKYVESFAKQGYIGTVGGINLYTKKDAASGKVVIATKKAVTLFNKKGTEVEQQREENIRRNTIYSRKYYVAAMTDATKAVGIITGTAAATTDSTVNSAKTYYAKSGVGYVKVEPAEGDNPKTKGWFEITPA